MIIKSNKTDHHPLRIQKWIEAGHDKFIVFNVSLLNPAAGQCAPSSALRRTEPSTQ